MLPYLEALCFRYAKFLARYPLAVLVCTISVCLACILSVFLVTDLPDFSNPIKGFQTRGTEISQRLLALDNLRTDLDPMRGQHNVFYRFPGEYESAMNISKSKKQKKKSKSPRRIVEDDLLIRERFVSEKSNTSHQSKDDGQSDTPFSAREVDLQKPLRFCNMNPGPLTTGEYYAMLAFEIKSGLELFSTPVFTDLCLAEQRLWSAAVASAMNMDDDQSKMGSFVPPDSCVRHESQQSCCQPWHLASITAHLLEKPDCTQINETDIDWIRSIVDYCRPYAEKQKRSLSIGDMETNKGVPHNCTSYAINLLYQFVLPKEYSTENATVPSVGMTLMILPVFKEAYKNLTLDQIERLPKFLSTDHIRMVAMDLGIRDSVFQEYLLKDTVFGTLALVLVFLAMWIYSGSFLFTLAAMIGIDLSVGLAYFVYRLVFKIEFFPFMNLLTYVLIVGVGADDAFIFRSAWMKAKFDKNSGTHAKILSDTLSHAAVSMFVTSLTTAAAFYTNIFSHIIAVKCFGIFAGTTILTNYVLVITWLPACVILSEKRPIFSTSYCWCCPRWCILRQRRHLEQQELRNRSASADRRQSPAMDLASNESQNHRRHLDDEDPQAGSSSRRNTGLDKKKIFSLITNPAQRRYQELTILGRVFFQKLLPWLVIKLRFLWLSVFGAVAILSAVAVFYSPSLKLPSKDYFQFFKPSHPFELWENDVKQRFRFMSDNMRIPLMMYVVWGIEPTSDASNFDPDHVGTLKAWPNSKDTELIDNVNLIWLRDFCSSMAVQNFTKFPSDVPMIASCFAGDFMATMNQRPCTHPVTKRSQRPCCSEVQFPYPPGVLRKCLRELVTVAKENFQQQLNFEYQNQVGPTGPYFSAVTGRPSGLTVMFASKYNFTFSYSSMHEFYETANRWVDAKLNSGPSSVRNGWMIADHLHLYDLQRALTSGTRVSVLIALAIAFGVLFITTWNPLISFLAILSISSIIVTTIAVLILLDWELNVLESTIIILTIGLSFDFTLHYGVAYKLCPTSEDRESRVIYALGEVGSPVFMAFVTTFLAGAAMLPSTTLAYFQIGLFMILETMISWIYSTFFFTSLLHLLGPAGKNCEFNPRNMKCRTKSLIGSGGSSVSGTGRRVSRDIGSEAALVAAARRKKSSIVSFNAVAFNSIQCPSPLPMNSRTSPRMNALTPIDYRRPTGSNPVITNPDDLNHNDHGTDIVVETEPMIDTTMDTPDQISPDQVVASEPPHANVDVSEEEPRMESAITEEPIRKKKLSLKDRATSFIHRFSMKKASNTSKPATIEMDEREDVTFYRRSSDGDEKIQLSQQPSQDVMPFIDGEIVNSQKVSFENAPEGTQL